MLSSRIYDIYVGMIFISHDLSAKNTVSYACVIH